MLNLNLTTEQQAVTTRVIEAARRLRGSGGVGTDYENAYLGLCRALDALDRLAAKQLAEYRVAIAEHKARR